jgi:hypothetical protein
MADPQSKPRKNPWDDPAYRLKERERRKAVWQRSEYRRAQVERSKAWWKNVTPERQRSQANLIPGGPIMVGAENPRWKGGRRIDRFGYWVVRVAPGRYRREHRIIAERALGRPLARNETVHHIDGNRLNNVDNLMIMSHGYHQWLERKLEWRRNPKKVSADRRKAQRASTLARSQTTSISVSPTVG